MTREPLEALRDEQAGVIAEGIDRLLGFPKAKPSSGGFAHPFDGEDRLAPVDKVTDFGQGLGIEQGNDVLVDLLAELPAYLSLAALVIEESLTRPIAQ